MITIDKVTEIFCVIDEFCKNFDAEMSKNIFKKLPSSDGKRHRNRKGQLSESEIMTIIVCYHFGSFANFKHYYLLYIKQHLSSYFPNAVSYNRFVELMPRVFFHLMLLMKLQPFGKCSGISFVDSTMIPVCHNLRRYANKVFKGVATDGKGTMGWCHVFKLHLLCNDSKKGNKVVMVGHVFKLHLLCNDSGEIITFCLTGANVDDRDKRVWTVFAKELYGKVFADRGYIKKKLFEELFDRGVHFVHGIKTNMKNKLMPMWDKIMLRKRYIIECINDLLKNTANIVHSRHRSIQNFIINICGALAAYSFFENKPKALPVHIEESNQLCIF